MKTSASRSEYYIRDDDVHEERKDYASRLSPTRCHWRWINKQSDGAGRIVQNNSFCTVQCRYRFIWKVYQERRESGSNEHWSSSFIFHTGKFPVHRCIFHICSCHFHILCLKRSKRSKRFPSISIGTHSKLCIDNWNHTYIDQICCSYRCRHIFQLDEKKEAKMWADPSGRFTFTVARHLSCVGRMKISWTSLVRIELYL